MWDEITYSFPNFNDGTVEVCEFTSNFIPHFTSMWLIAMIWIKLNHVSKRGLYTIIYRLLGQPCVGPCQSKWRAMIFITISVACHQFTKISIVYWKININQLAMEIRLISIQPSISCSINFFVTFNDINWLISLMIFHGKHVGVIP